MSTLRTILVMAGGTGGHIYPALAVAEAMATRGWNVVWLGSRESMESKLVPTFGYPMRLVSFGGLRGKGLLAKLLLPTRLLVAFSQAELAEVIERRLGIRFVDVAEGPAGDLAGEGAPPTRSCDISRSSPRASSRTVMPDSRT